MSNARGTPSKAKALESSPVPNACHALMLGAMGATVHHPAGFHPVPHDSATAMSAFRCERVNGALEGIKIMGDAVHQDLKRLVVFVPAHLAFLKTGMQLIFGSSSQVRR